MPRHVPWKSQHRRNVGAGLRAEGIVETVVGHAMSKAFQCLAECERCPRDAGGAVHPVVHDEQHPQRRVIAHGAPRSLERDVEARRICRGRPTGPAFVSAFGSGVTSNRATASSSSSTSVTVVNSKPIV